MGPVTALTGRVVTDSRGAPAIEATVRMGGHEGTASVPAGASVGRREAKTVPAPRALAGIAGELSQALTGRAFNQQEFDRALIELDGTPDKSHLGGNTLLGLSLAFARAAATAQEMPLYAYVAAEAGAAPALPCPMFNLINGGKHAPHSNLDIQEFLAVPNGITGAAQQLAAGEALVAALKTILQERGLGTDTGDEGGFAPALPGDASALDLLAEARERAGFTSGQVALSLDAAASSSSVAHDEAWWENVIQTYGLLSVEDPFGEDDPPRFASLRARTPAVIVGDDLTVTQARLIAAAASAGAINGVILKPNQAGTLSETIDAAHAAHEAGLTTIASHRSGETMDNWIADVAVGLGCSYLKAGAPTRPERKCKYNRLMEISRQLI